jgi:LmbE family N-acetylglucosaminyl deacetylase
MRPLPLLGGPEPLRRVLAIGCHADDIEIGCGGTVLTMLAAEPAVEVTWVVLAASAERADEARTAAAAFLGGAAGATVVVHPFRDGFLPYAGEVKEVFEGLKAEVDPQLILTHWEGDAHQDHRLASELTWNTWRNHTILEYEVPKVDGDLGRPSVYVPIEAAVVERKIELLLEHFPSQRQRHWFDPEVFRGLARLRGMEAVSPTRYAEAFYARTLVLTP